MDSSCLLVHRHAAIALIGVAVSIATPCRSSAADNDSGPAAQTTSVGQISVSVASGRTFVGQLDPQTDRDLLWLRIGDGAIVLRRPIEWGRVVRVRQGTKQLTADDLQSLALGLKQAPHRPLLPPPPVPAADWTVAKTWLTIPPTGPAPNGNGEPNGQRGTELPPTVASLQIEAELGHWTWTVEPSGIVVYIHPTTADGTLVPIDGTLAVDCIAQRPASQGEGNGLDTIGRWTQMVRPTDFGPLGAEYRFPFQAVHPEFDYELLPHGIVHARLTVPGQGTFEASQAMVRLRPYSSVRDRLQQQTGSRYAPIEEINP